VPLARPELPADGDKGSAIFGIAKLAQRSFAHRDAQGDRFPDQERAFDFLERRGGARVRHRALVELHAALRVAHADIGIVVPHDDQAGLFAQGLRPERQLRRHDKRRRGELLQQQVGHVPEVAACRRGHGKEPQMSFVLRE